MDLTAINLDRVAPGAAPIVAKAAVRPASTKAAIADRALAARFKFLTADGQATTALEQEALLGTNDLVEASFLDRCQLVASCVGRLRFTTPQGRSYATGFLIAPGLMMTNHHVFPDETVARGASVQFDYRYNIAGQILPGPEFDLQPDQFFVADKELDFAVVAVAPKSVKGIALDKRGYLRLNPESGKAEENDFVTIIQYPDGDPLRLALRENKVTRAKSDEAVIWYEADTAHGSSGAPVFNDSFQVAALHASGRIKRNDNGEYALRRGGWAASLVGLKESEVVWEANVGFRISQISARLVELAGIRSQLHRQLIEDAMKGGDVLASAIAKLKSGASEPEFKQGEKPMPIPSAAPSTSNQTVKTEVLVPLQLRVSLELAGSASAAHASQVVNSPQATELETEAFKMQIPVIYDNLDQRHGFDRKFLELPDGVDAPMPALTGAGERIAAPLLDGSGHEIKYNKFSIWMHKDRRLALFTASNVDWRARKKSIDGKKLTRDSLAGFPPDSLLAEEWAGDERIAPKHQLPDVFYTEDRGAFDKGHLVRRDDVCWGKSFEDIQMANGDTFHVTNCSPQIKAFNQGTAGEENWGDLEAYVQKVTKKDQEVVVIYAGPIFSPTDRWFRGTDESAGVRIQIPSRFWKIVVTGGAEGPKAYGFVLEQEVRDITEKEFLVSEEWIGHMKRISDIEAEMRGWLSFQSLSTYDAFDSVQ